VLLSLFPFSWSTYLFIDLLFVSFFAGSSSLLLSFLNFSSVSPLSLSSHLNHSPFICSFLYLIFTLSSLSLPSLATSLNFFCVFLSSFVKSSSIYILSRFLSFNLLLFSIMFFFCSQIFLILLIYFKCFFYVHFYPYLP
jgi:hypothetical protein